MRRLNGLYWDMLFNMSSGSDRNKIKPISHNPQIHFPFHVDFVFPTCLPDSSLFKLKLLFMTNNPSDTLTIYAEGLLTLSATDKWYKNEGERNFGKEKKKNSLVT